MEVGEKPRVFSSETTPKILIHLIIRWIQIFGTTLEENLILKLDYTRQILMFGVDLECGKKSYS